MPRLGRRAGTSAKPAASAAARPGPEFAGLFQFVVPCPTCHGEDTPSPSLAPNAGAKGRYRKPASFRSVSPPVWTPGPASASAMKAKPGPTAAQRRSVRVHFGGRGQDVPPPGAGSCPDQEIFREGRPGHTITVPALTAIWSSRLPRHAERDGAPPSRQGLPYLGQKRNGDLLVEIS